MGLYCKASAICTAWICSHSARSATSCCASSAPASAPCDTLSPTNSIVPSQRVSGSLPPHLICRTAAPPLLAYQHSRSQYLISCLRTVRTASASPLQRGRECTPMILPFGHCSTSDNPPAAPQCRYRSDPVTDSKSAFDILSWSRAYRPSRPGGLATRTECMP